MQNGKEITLGRPGKEQKFLVIPQSIGYLDNKLGPRLKEVLETELDNIEGLAQVSAKAHGILAIFIPALMPLHEFLGYASETALEAKHYDEDNDPAPTVPQVKAAFEAVSSVNGGEILSHLKALLGPEITQRAVAMITATVAEKFRSQTSEPLQTSPSTSGGLGSTSSSTTPQTSPPSAD